MSKYEATFNIESRADAEAVRLLVERVYDVFREEAEGTDYTSLDEMLDAFEAIRDATTRPTPGTLTIRYEQRDTPFEN